ncbi:hypothetical protein QR680_014476 [Steinernema hermaphroditum]|uniref:Uncharacterized protein n=1 Tax=Steinernema hermaphroditum TaxID=289476 RepID=A0AA39I901_9BILA|nr:hypothetical protein QR680_014476 [Steinernema hermaphroditum]
MKTFAFVLLLVGACQACAPLTDPSIMKPDKKPEPTIVERIQSVNEEKTVINRELVEIGDDITAKLDEKKGLQRPYEKALRNIMLAETRIEKHNTAVVVEKKWNDILQENHEILQNSDHQMQQDERQRISDEIYAAINRGASEEEKNALYDRLRTVDYRIREITDEHRPFLLRFDKVFKEHDKVMGDLMSPELHATVQNQVKAHQHAIDEYKKKEVELETLINMKKELSQKLKDLNKELLDLEAKKKAKN